MFFKNHFKKAKWHLNNKTPMETCSIYIVSAPTKIRKQMLNMNMSKIWSSFPEQHPPYKLMRQVTPTSTLWTMLAAQSQ